MRFSDVIGSATSNMMRNKVRAILTIIAIVIGSFTITLTVGLSAGISAYIDKQLGGIGADDVLVVQPHVDFASASDGPQKYDPKSGSSSAQAAFAAPSMTAEDIEKIKSQKGIVEARPSVMVALDYVSGPNGEKYQLDNQELVESMSYDIVAGRAPSNSTDALQVLLPSTYVSVLGFGSAEAAVGKKVTLAISTPSGRQVETIASITGVQRESILSQGGATLNKPLTDELYGLQTEGVPAEVSEKYFAVVARFDTNGALDVEAIKKELLDKGYDAKTVEDQIGIIKQIIDAITSVLIFFGAIALLAASFGIINTLFMSVQERTKEIGLMKAMGMSRSKVFLLFSVEAILLGFWGSLIGAGLAFVAGQVANQIARESFLKDLPGFDLTVFPVLSVLSIMAAVMLIALLSGTLPARRAAKQDPIEALRYE